MREKGEIRIIAVCALVASYFVASSLYSGCVPAKVLGDYCESTEPKMFYLRVGIFSILLIAAIYEIIKYVTRVKH